MEHHLFVCTGPTCSGDGAEESLQAINCSIIDQGLSRRVRVTLCRCLGQCGHGPNMVIYPQGIWYSHVGPHEAEQIVTRHLLQGEILHALVHTPID